MDRYEEALERAKAGKPMDEVFPELKESEDERIRKWLVELVKNTDTNHSNIKLSENCKLALAYLEKHKEQEPLSTEETELNSIAFLEQMGYTCIPPKKEHQNNSDAPKNALGGALNSPLDKDKNLDDIAQDYVEAVKEYNPELTWDLMQTAVCYGYHYREEEEQKPNIELIQRSWYMEGYTDGKFKREPMWNLVTGKGGPMYEKNEKYGQPLEQKPAHTAKEMWKEMRLEVYAQASGNRHEPNYSDDSTKMFSLCDIDEIFEKIGNSTVGSRPAEWSEEEIVNWLKENFYVSSFDNTKIVTKFSSMDDLIKSVRKRLKSLPERFNLQPKQEWSEEDEKKIHFLKNLIQYQVRDDDYCFGYNGRDYVSKQEAIEMLLSLRPQPHWKPSEEQMEALKDAVKLYKETHFERFHTRIESLYEQLKSL